MSKKKTTKEFIHEAIQVHGDKYSYTHSVYKTARTNIDIECAVHGPFKQIAYNHLKGQGCPKCGKLARIVKTTDTVNHYLQCYKEKHGDKYNYSKMNFQGPLKVITIICPIHGEFKQTAKAHKYYGCKKCANSTVACKNKLLPEEVKNKCIKTHKDKYDYTKTDFTLNVKDPSAVITCKKHGDFTQRLQEHYGGKGCIQCGIEVGRSWSRTAYKNKRTSLYYIKINSEYYKIGITRQTIKKRYCMEHVKIDIIKEFIYEDGSEAFDIENKILKELSAYRAKNLKVLKHGGNTEIFTSDVLNKIEEIIKKGL